MTGQQLAIIYLVPSTVALVTYGIDKGAAIRGGRRVPEAYLHLLGLACGWPGAFLAQRIFRHKCSKRSFQVIFWLVAALNALVALWVWR